MQQRRDYQRQYAKANPEAMRDKTFRANIKKLYGLTPEDYWGMFDAQNGVCAICNEPESITTTDGVRRRLAVDHDHKTGRVRALLCTSCNLGLGAFKDDPERLAAALAYLDGMNDGI